MPCPRRLIGRLTVIACTSLAGALPVGLPLAYGHVGQRGSPVATPCPHTVPAGPPANQWEPAEGLLAPKGAIEIRLCRYSGLNDKPPVALIRSALVTRPKPVAIVVGEFDSLPPAGTGTAVCPADDGSAIVAYLAYRHGHSVTIVTGLSGCGGSFNGDVGSAGYGRAGQRLLHELHRLLKARG